MNYTNLELENLTLQWGIDRKITINGKLETQFLKLIEESGELFSSGDDIEKIKDAIGDQLVVLTMINGLINNKFVFDIFTNKPSSFSEATLILCTIQGGLASNIVRSRISELNVSINEYFIILDYFATFFKTNINECWNHAYNEIKDRKGYLAENGCFIKEEDYLKKDSILDKIDFFNTQTVI